MARDDWFTIGPGAPPFQEALDYFTGLDIMERSEFLNLAADMRAKAFTVAAVAKADVLQSIHGRLTRALSEGETLADFKKALDPEDFLSAWHRETVFRTNVLKAYGRGHWEQAQAVKDRRPYARYSAVMDGRTRPTHAALHGKIYPLSHPFWKQYWPPWDFNCRCAAITMSVEEAKGKLGEINKNLEDWDRNPGIFPQAREFVSPAAAPMDMPPKIKPKLDPALAKQVDEAARAEAARPRPGMPEEIKGDENLEALWRKFDATGDIESLTKFGQAYLEKFHPDLIPHVYAGEHLFGDTWGDYHRAFMESVFPMKKRTVPLFREGLAVSRKYADIDSVALSKEWMERLLPDGFYLDRLDQIEIRAKLKRASASYYGRKITMNPTDPIHTFVHEMGHHAEYSSATYRQAAIEWRDAKGKGPAKTLRSITGMRGYDLDEMALSDDFSHPYKGKIYERKIGPNTTEVISMFFDQFSDKDQFVKLAKTSKYRDELYFFVGLLKSNLW